MNVALPLGNTALPVPPDWKLKTVGSICDANNGEVQTGPFGSQLHARDYCDVGTPVVMPQDLIDGTVSLDQIARVPDSDVQRLARHQLRPNDIIYSRRGDVTRFAIVKEREKGWMCGTGCMRIRLNASDVFPSYLSHYLRNRAVRDWLIFQAKGATMPNLNTTILRSMPILVPPLAKQKRIAAILDQADAVRRKRQQALALTDQFLRATFLEMFGDPMANPKGWPVVTLGSRCDILTGYAFKSSEYAPDSSTRLCRGANVLPRTLDWTDVRFWNDDDEAVDRKYLIEAGDIILAMDRPWISSGLKVARATTLDLPSLLVQRVARIRANEGASNAYIYACINHPQFTRHCAPLTTETTIPHISPKDIASFPIFDPPTVLLKRFAQIEGHYECMVRRLVKCDILNESLFHSLVQRAFRDEL